MPLDTKSNGINMGSDSPVVWVVPEALQQLVECGDTELVEELIAIFQSDTTARLEVLRRAIAAGDWAAVRVEGHTIKGSAVQVGANCVAEACRQLELEARKSAPLDLEWLFHRLQQSFDEACGAMAARNEITGKLRAL
jgi:HPt (histidine-containing phosphotransfer) domain-containing protein